MTVTEALALMGLTAVPSDAATLKAAYREKAKTAHPDAGGSDAAMAMLAEALQVLSNAEPGFSGRVKCRACKGTGHVVTGWTSGGECPSCKGTGWKLERNRDVPAGDSVWLRDVDGTGSMHVCAKGDPGAVEYVPA